MGVIASAWAGDACGPRGRPCWKATGGSGFRYKDPDAASDGVRTIRTASRSSEQTRLSLQASNNAGKGQTALPVGIAAALQDATQARVQIVTTDGACFDAALADVGRADGAEFEAKAP